MYTRFRKINEADFKLKYGIRTLRKVEKYSDPRTLNLDMLPNKKTVEILRSLLLHIGTL